MTAEKQAERRVSFRAGYDKRHDDPSKDYGIAGVKIRFALIDGDRAVTWDLLTDWFVDGVSLHGLGPTAGAVSWHWAPERVGSDQEHFWEEGDCDVLPGGRCRGDAVYMIGDEAFRALRHGGEDGLWEFLAEQLAYDFADEEVEVSS